MKRIRCFIIFCVILFSMSSVSFGKTNESLSNRITVEKSTEDSYPMSGTLIIKEKKAGALEDGTVLRFSSEDKDKISVRYLQIEEVKGDIKVNSKWLDGEVVIKEASTKPSTIVIAYTIEANRDIPYKDYDMYVTEQERLNTGSVVVKKGFCIVPEEIGYTYRANKTVYFRNNSTRYIRSGKQVGKIAKRENEVVQMPEEVYRIDHQMMVPLRYLVGEFDQGKLACSGRKIQADFTVKKDVKHMELEIGSKVLYINGEKRMMCMVPTVKNGLTFVPVSEIVEAIGLESEYETESKSVKIYIPQNPVINNVWSEAEPAHPKTGLIKQEVPGTVYIHELQDKRLSEGEIVLELKKEMFPEGIQIAEKPQVLVTQGDLRLGEIICDEENPRTIRIPIKQISKTPSTISISFSRFTVDRTVPEDDYFISVGGSALEEEQDVLFVVIRTPNTQCY